MNAQHTPGPWGVLTTSIGPACETVCIGQLNEEKGLNGVSDEYAVCVVPLVHDESRANARLIAAAPDLLAALKFTVADCDNSDCEQCEVARAAIAKATGAA
jgi:hypothetical protein